MAAPGPGPVPLLRCPGSALPWQPSSSPLCFPRQRRRSSPSTTFSGCRRQDYSHSSDMGVRGSGHFKVGFYANFNVQNIAQEWVEESKRLLYLRTINNVKKNIYNGTTPLRAGNLLHELPEDHRVLNNHYYLHDRRDHVSSMSIVNRCDSTELVNHSMINQPARYVSAPVNVVNTSVKQLSASSGSNVETLWLDSSLADNPLHTSEAASELDDKAHDGDYKRECKIVAKKVILSLPITESFSKESENARKVLAGIYDKVMIVDNIESARSVVQLLTTKYKGFIHACDTEVSNINVKEETPVGHGEVICFSIFSANSDSQAADFGNGKTCIWVDVLDGGRDVLMEFAPFFEDPSIKKVWHNYSFDRHVIENHGIKVAGFHADTMHLARLWDSSRKTDGGYSLEGLTNDHRVMDAVPEDLSNARKTSMKTIFEIEKTAVAEREVAAEKFRKWASKYCPDAKYMNVNSDTQIRQLLFAGIENRHKSGETWPQSRTFKVPNQDFVATEDKKTSKCRTVKLYGIVDDLKIDMFTPSGWPSVSGDALRSLAGKIATEHIYSIDDNQGDDEGTGGSEDPNQDVDDKSSYGTAYEAFGGGKKGKEACHAIAALCEICSIDSLISNFILPLQGDHISCKEGRIHCSLNINTETGRLSARTPNLQNQPALEKDRYKIRQAFVAAPGNSLIVADYGQLELRILAHLTNCKSMLDAFKAGGDFHSRTAMNMYQHIRDAVEEERVLLEWHPQPGQEKPPVPLLKDAFGAERRKAKMLNFSIAYGKTAVGLSRDWKVSVKEARHTLKLWYRDRKEVLAWQKRQKELAHEKCEVYTLLGRSRRFPNPAHVCSSQRGHIERAAINAPVQGSAADVAMCAMLEIDRNTRLKGLGWRLLLQVHDEVILEGPEESADAAKAIVVECMSKPFYGTNFLKVDLAVDAKCAKSWYAAK
ncbi:hypothetical protein QOZ80_8BG0646660 [Eleusine coracana subsp. coracana]|nr:hypothetical protein QOZ80_8BG0646660 [Eleusine coracana subsp. coracana]